MQIKTVTRRGFIRKSFLTAIPFAFSSFAVNGKPTMGSSTLFLSSELDVPDLDRVTALLKQKDPLIWVFTGDSITQGAHHTHGLRSYPEVFEERIRWELSRRRDAIINTGISGNTTQSILDDFDWRVKAWRPSVVSLMIGTNDCSSKTISADVFERNLDSILVMIRGIGAIPILHTPNGVNKVDSPYPSRAKLPEYIKVIQNLAKKRKVILVDNWTYWQDTLLNKPEANVLMNWLDDPLHPNGKGHQEIAQLMFKKLSIFDPKAPTCKG